MNANKNSSKASTNDIKRGQRLKKLMKEKRIRRNELAELIGKSGSTVTFYTQGGLFPPDVAAALADALGTTVEYLLYGNVDEAGSNVNEEKKDKHEIGSRKFLELQDKRGQNLELSNVNASNTGKHSTNILTSSGEYLKPVPYYRTVQSKTNSDNIEMTGEVIEYVYMRDLNDCDMMIVLHSNSMLGKYNPGQRLGLRRVYDLRLIEYGEVFYIRTREFNTIKYLWPVEGQDDVVKLVPANKEYPAYNIPKELIDELYIVRYEGRPTVN